MEREELEALLTKLQTELESHPPVDAELRASLQELQQDITGMLSSDTPLAATADDSLAQRAQEIDARFSTEHPYLTSIVRDVMDLLGKIGI